MFPASLRGPAERVHSSAVGVGGGGMAVKIKKKRKKSDDGAAADDDATSSGGEWMSCERAARAEATDVALGLDTDIAGGLSVTEADR